MAVEIRPGLIRKGKVLAKGFGRVTVGWPDGTAGWFAASAIASENSAQAEPNFDLFGGSP